MAREISNEDSGAGRADDAVDSLGQAAILLVESLIHGLIARDVISVAAAVEIIDVATDVQAEVEAEAVATPADPRTPLAILESIGASLARDLPRD